LRTELTRDVQAKPSAWQTARMSSHPNLLGEPPPTLLPADEAPSGLIASGTPAVDVAARYPAFSLAWAVLAEDAMAAGHPVESYAYARTGYHRGLDALRRSGWKGHGPIPWSHVPNQGFLRSLAALARAASAIEEYPEADRCRAFLRDSSGEAYAELIK
jgi:Protein of unknown function (DUF3151)